MILQKTYRFFGELSISIDSWILERMFDFFGVGHSSLRSVGLPHLTVRKGAKASVGKGFRINNRFYGNALSVQKCAIWVGENARLDIGRDVGISSSHIVASDSTALILKRGKIPVPTGKARGQHLSQSGRTHS